MQLVAELIHGRALRGSLDVIGIFLLGEVDQHQRQAVDEGLFGDGFRGVGIGRSALRGGCLYGGHDQRGCSSAGAILPVGETKVGVDQDWSVRM